MTRRSRTDRSLSNRVDDLENGDGNVANDEDMTPDDFIPSGPEAGEMTPDELYEKYQASLACLGVDSTEVYMRMMEEAGHEGDAAAAAESGQTSEVFEAGAAAVEDDEAADDGTTEDDDDAEEGATDADGDADSGGGSGDSNDTDGADDAATADADREGDVDTAGDSWQRTSGDEGMSGAERGRRRSDSSNFGKSPEERRKDYHDRREWS